MSEKPPDSVPTFPPSNGAEPEPTYLIPVAEAADGPAALQGLSGRIGRPQLVSLIRAEQQRGWAAGHPARLEEYTGLLERAGAGEEEWLDLIAHEALLREQCGESLDAEEYAGRFPPLAQRIRSQFALLKMLLRDKAPAQTQNVRTPLDISGLPSGPNDRTLLQRIDATPIAVPAQIQVPGYDIEEVIGRGGMGVVYKARQKGLNRLVALKMILAGGHADAEDRRRFLLEAEAVAALRHPNIVQIYEIGEYEGKPYLSLEYVGGGTLHQRVNGQPQPHAFAITVIEQLARAIHSAHEQGIIHRDLKPANILLSAESGANADSRTQIPATEITDGLDLNSMSRNPHFATPKITDFGLAKRIGIEMNLTVSGTVAGTPNYMAPEQVFTDTRTAVGPGVDIYALGVIFYEMLTGRPPFLADSPLEVMQLVAHREPLPPRELQPKVPRDLETICLKCLQKEPRKRYSSALALAEDLRRVRENLPITARPISRLEQGWRWCRRNPTVAGLLGAVTVILALGVGVASYFAVKASNKAHDAEASAEQARQKEEDAQRSAAEAQKSAAEARRLTQLAKDQAEEVRRGERQRIRELYAARMAQARRDWETGQVARSRQILASYEPLRHEDDDLRRWEWFYLASLCRLEGVSDVGFNVPLGARSVALSQDADWNRGRITWSFKDTAEVWELSGKRLWSLGGHKAKVHCVAYDPANKYIATAAADGGIRLWDAGSGAHVRDFAGLKFSPQGLSFSPDGKLLAVAAGDPSHRNAPGAAIVWNVSTGEVRHTLKEQKLPVFGVAFSKDGKHLAVGGTGEVRICDADNGELFKTLETGRPALCVAYSPSDSLLAAGLDDGSVVVWNADSGRELRRLAAHSGPVNAIDFSRDGIMMATGGTDRMVRVWESGTGRQLRLFAGHTGDVRSLAFGRGALLISASDDGNVSGWHADQDPECRSIPPEQGGGDLVGLHILPGTRFAVAHQGRGVTVQDHQHPAQTSLLPYPSSRNLKITASSASRDGRTLALLAPPGRVMLLREGGQPPRPPEPLSLPVLSFALDAAGDRLATGHSQGRVHIFRLDGAGKSVEQSLSQHDITAVAFDPSDPGRLACGTAAGEVFHWELAGRWRPLAGERILTSSHDDRPVRAIAFSADGKLLAAGSDDGAVRLWNVPGADEPVPEPRRLEGHTGPVLTLAFNPDGDRLLSGSEDRTAKVWELLSGQETLTLTGHAKPVVGVAFSPDGRKVLTASRDGEVKVWDAGPVSLRERMRRVAAACRVRNIRVEGSLRSGEPLTIHFELANISGKEWPAFSSPPSTPQFSMSAQLRLGPATIMGVSGTQERLFLGEVPLILVGTVPPKFRLEGRFRLSSLPVKPGKYEIAVEQFWISDRPLWISSATLGVTVLPPGKTK